MPLINLFVCNKKTTDSGNSGLNVWKHSWLVIVIFFVSNISALSTTYYSRATGQWTTNTTWSLISGGASVGAGVFPVAGDNVIIERGFTVTVNSATSACSSLQIGSTTNGAGTLTFASGNALTVSGLVQVGGWGNAGWTGTITFINTSSLTAGNVILGGTGATPAAGTITMSGGSTLTTGSLSVGAGGGTWTPSTGSVILNATNTLPSSIFTSFYNLTISSATTTLGVNLNSIAGGSLTVNAGATLALSTFSFGATVPIPSTTLYCGATTGSGITGTGTYTLGGNVTVTNAATGTNGATISAPVALGATRTFTVADDGTSAADLTISGIIGGVGFGVTKAGTGRLVLSASNTYTGLTTISAGTLTLGAAGGGTNTPLGTTGAGTSVSSGALLDLNGFTLGTAEALTLNGTGILSSGALINSGGAATYNGAITLGSASSIGTTGNITLGINGISGGQDLTKVGSATLSLGSGTSTVNNLTISAGTLTSTSGTLNIGADFINSGTFTHNSGTTNFNAAGSQAVAGVTYNNLTLSGSGTKNFSAGVVINGSLSITGALAGLVAGSTITSNSLTLNGVAQSSGTWGSTSSAAANKNDTYFAATTGMVNVVTSSCTAGTWLGTTSTDWNNASNWCGGIPISTTNVIIPSGGNQPIIGAAGGLCNNLTINAGATLTISGSNALTISGNWTNNGGTFTPNTGTVTFNGAAQSIAGTASTTFSNLTISSGTTTLGVALPTVNGALTVNAGATLALSTYNLGATSAPTSTILYCGAPTGSSITGTGILTLGGNITVNDVTTGTAGALISSPVALGATRTFTVTDDGTSVTDLTISGIISGAGFGVIKAGTGTMLLSASNTFTGAVTINAGILSTNTLANAGTNSSLGTGSGTPSISIAGAGTLQYTGSGHSTSRAIILTGSGATIDASGTGAMTLSGAVTGNTFNLILTGTGSATESGVIGTTSGTVTVNGGTWTLSGASTYTGLTTVSAGTLKLGAGSNVAGSGPLGTNAGGVTVSSGAVLDLNGNTIGAINGEALTINGTGLTVLPAGALTNTGAAASYLGTITLGSASTITATASGTLAVAAVTNGPNALTLDGAGSGTVSGVIGASSGTVIKNGNGTWTLSGANTYTGGTTLNTGTLNINNANALGTAAGTFTINGGTINNTSGGPITTLNYPQTWGGDFTFTGSNALNLGIGAVTMNASMQVTTSASSLTAGGTITGSSYNLTKSGGGALTLGTNAVTLNNLTISAGTLTASSGTMNIGGNFSNSGTFTNNSGTVNFNGSSPQTIGGSVAAAFNNFTLSGSGGVTLGINATVNNTLTLSSGNLTTGSYTLIVSSSAIGAVSRTSGQVVGNLQRAIALGTNTYNFNIGTSTSYTPVSIGFTTVTTGGNLTASVTQGQNPNGGTPVLTTKDVNLYWTLVNSGIILTSYAPTFTYNTGDIIGGATQSSFIVGKYSGASWSAPLPVTNAGTGPYTSGVAGQTTYGDFVVGEAWFSSLATDYFRSIAIGNWSSPTTWQSSHDGITWGLSSLAPTSSANSITIQSPNTVTVDVNNQTASSVIIANGSTLVTGTNNLLVSGNWTNNGGTFTPGTGTVLFNGTTQSLGGTASTTFTNLTISTGTTTLGIASTVNGTLTVSAGATLALSTFTLGSPSSLVLECGAPIASSLTGSGILTLGGNVTVNDVTTGIAGATISAPVALGATRTFTVTDDGTSATDLTISGIISGGGFGVTKAGTGTMVLSAANTYTGTVTINAGILSTNTLANAGTNSSLGTGSGTPSISIAGAGTLQYTGSGHSTSRAIILTGSGATIDASGAGAMTLSGGVTGNTYNLILTGTGVAAESGVINTTSGTVAVNGGTWTLSGVNTYTGGTTLNSGTLNINNASALGTIVGTFTINGGIINNTTGGAITTLNYPQTWGGDFTFTGSNALNLGTGIIALSSSRQVTVTANTLTVGGIINSGTYNLIKTGAGTLTMGANPVTLNGLTISAGTLTAPTGTLNIGGDFSNNGTFTNSGGTVNFNGVAAQSIGAATIPVFNNLTISNTSAIVTANTDISIAGTLTLNANAILNASGKSVSITNSSAASVAAGAGSYLNGILSRAMVNAGGTYIFPVGSSVCSGSHWLTFSAVSGITPTMKVTFACSGAINGDATIATPMPININWHVEKVSGTFTDATVKLESSEIDFTNTMAQAALQQGTYSKVTSVSAIGSVTAVTIGAITTDKWLAIGSSTVKTYYSYQTGSWNAASTWTMDHSGTTQVGSSVPGSNDNVEILSGRTVSLPANNASTGLNVTIDQGGFLDLSTFQFTNGFNTLAGQGTLIISSSPAVFPTPITTNTFILAGGGTTEYRSNSILPAQAVYNNLSVNANSLIVTQTIDLTLNGNLYVKSGTFRINDGTTRKLKLTVNGDVTVDAGAFLTVGTGVTNSVTNPLGITGGAAPFLNYYDQQSHRIVLKGDFTNHGTVRFTNLAYPVFNAFPPTSGVTAGFATVYFQGASDNTLLCGGTTDFYNLVVDKGIDKTFKLTIYTSGSSYANFRLFGANVAGGEGGTANPGLKKALWIRTGTLVLQGTTIIPSLTEGTGIAEVPVASPNSDYYIPANGALLLDGTDVIVLSTADDYREVNLAYNTAAPSNAAMGITAPGSSGSALSLYGKLQINNGYLSTRESGGIVTNNISPGQFILNSGTVDTKQFLGSTGSASYEQNGGLLILRGRFQRTPASYASVANLVDVTTSTLNNIRATSGITGTYGSFNLNNANNVFAMSGGTIRIYDVCGDGSSAAQQKAFDILSSTANCNVTGGTLEMIPTTGSVPANDSPNFLITTNSVLGSLTINRASSTSIVQLNTNPLTLLNNFTLTSGVFNANNLNVTISGDISVQAGTTYTPGTNTTILNGSSTQTFTVNLLAALSLNKLTIDKPAGVVLNFAGTQNTINVADNFRLVLATLNDNGNTLNVYKDVFNSGIIAGAGKLTFLGTIAQAIDGNGVFGNVELNNNTAVAAPVSLVSNMTINGALTFSSDKLFNIGTNNLILKSTASIVNGGATRYIQTSGNAGDGGLTKEYASTTAFIFPIGAPSTSHVGVPKYTPATIGFTAPPATSYGSITVIPVGYEHPATTTNGQSLTYFWRIKSSGFVGIAANSVTHTFVYDQTDVVGAEASYIPSLYDRANYTWNSGTNANPPINIATNNITDWITPTNSHAFLDADYTAGISAFGTPVKFYSRQSGLWGQTTTWWSPIIGTAAVTTPGVNDIVIIRNGHTVSFDTPAVPNYLTQGDTDPHSCASLQIETGAVLDVRFNPSSNFGMVLSHPNGNGTIRVTTNYNYPTTYVFPSGDFSDFNVNMGTTELYTTNTNAGPEFYLPENVSSYGNLVLSPVGGSNVMFPNQNVLIYGNLITRGQNADSWFCPSWGITYPGNITAIAKTIHVKGNMDIQGGSLIWYANGALAENFAIDGDVTISPLSALYIYSGATNQSMTIGGSLINNADGISHVGTPSKCDFTNIMVTFNGSNSAKITNTIGTPSTTFSQVTVNKGNSQATTLTCDIAGTLTTPTDNWLTLQNGTFKYMRTNPSSDFTINTTSTFTIPSSAGLYIDYSNSGAKNILIANNPADASDLILNGKLTVKNGSVFVGPTGFPNNSNDIEYSGGGASEIEVTGGNLFVNGQIRRNPAVNNGVLKYTQSGGNVTINGNATVPNPTNAKLEVLNTGSTFNMSAGTITLVKGGGTTFGDLYLRPETGSVTGGTILFTNVTPNTLQTYLLDATIPLNHLTITGAAGAGINATVKLMVNPLVLNGNLTLTNTQSIFDANSASLIPVTINGDFTNNGLYNHYNNLTIFSGGTQSLLGSSATDFYDLNVNPVTKLILSKDISVNDNLSLGNGTLECTSFKVNVKGNVANSATFTNTTSTSGLVLNGTVQQHISGTGTFGQMELNNTNGSTLDNSITLNKDLILTSGIFDISQYLLTLGVNSNIVANMTPFGITKMVTSDGVWSNVGISKVFTSPLSTTFTYPLGSLGKYTPAVLTITNNGSVGSIRINNINSRHPSVVDPSNALKYYWEVEGTGISGFSGNLVLNYKMSDVVGGPESSYVAAVLLKPSTNWSKAAPGPATDNVDEINHTITFNFNNSSNLTGEYTAGNDAAIPSIVPQYTSNSSGNWSDNTIWDYTGPLPAYPCPVGGPNGFIVTINHEVTANANYCFAFKTTINNKLKVVNGFYGHNFGTVYGNGILYLESAVFPAGRFGSFLDCSGNGTIEYGGTGTYDINATLYSSIPRILISGTGSRVLPAKDLTICKQLKIDDGGSGPLTLDNSVNNRRLIINGTFERYNNGIFKSGTGSSAVVEFAGSTAQTIGGLLGDFSGVNGFNDLEINNSSGLSINNNGNVEINGNLLLTNGLISTTSTNKLTINNYSVSCVYPDGGSSSSYIDGPLIKKLNQGDPLFRFPVGKKAFGLGNNLSLRSTQTGTLYWVVEYFNPNTYSTMGGLLTAINVKEYWNVSGIPGTSQAFIDLSWNSSSALTPLMTQNGMSDMRVAEHNGTDWIDKTSGVVSGSDNNNGSVETSSRTVITTGSRNYTLGCVNTPKPTVRLMPAGPICGAGVIPVTLTSSLTLVAPFTVNYTENGVPKSISPASFPTTIPTIAGGATYILTGFTYNYPAGSLHTGAIDPNPVVVYAMPTTSNAGTDQSWCGATSTALAANSPAVGTGLWSIVSGAGGTLVAPTSPVSVFNGTNGTSYILRWTITNGTCISFDDVSIAFPLLPVVPLPFSQSSPVVCQGQTGVTYAVPLDPSVTYNWSYDGTGATINGTSNTITVDFNASATSGNLSVTTTNSCGTSSARTISITVTPIPVATFSYTGNPYLCNSSNPLPTFSGGGIAGTFSSTPGLVFISTATGQVNLAASYPGTYTVTNTIAPAGGCGVITATSTITMSPDIVWTGALNSDWNNSANWSCGFIPYPTSNVQIPNVANKPVLSAGITGSVNNLIINAGSSLTISGNTLLISGTITNNGIFDASNAILQFTGTVPQFIGANAFVGNTIKDLIINNTAGVVLQGPLNISGKLLLQNGDLTSAGNLTLLSTVSQTALIDGTGGGNVTGNVTMQRYLPSGFGYKYFTSPFQSATVNEFADNINLASPSILFYKYDESRIASGWVGYKIAANPLIPLAGYAVNCGSSSAANTIDITGIVNNGPLSVTLYNHNNTYTKGFNLIGNPYPSPIDWNAAAGWTKTNIDNALYYFKASTTDQYGGTYSSYINGISSDGSATNIIPSMQGFFIHVSDGSYPVSGTLAMTNNVRVTDLTHPFIGKKALITTISVPLIRLTARYSDDPSSIDPMVIYFDDKGTADFDSQIDALKLLNTDLNIPNLSTVCSDGTLLSINAMPPITGDMYTVPLGLKLNRTGTQTVNIKISDIDESLKAYNIFITDVIAGTQQDILPNNEFSVTLAKGEYDNRFFLNFTNLTTNIPETKVKNDFFSIYSFQGKIRATIFNLQGNSGMLTVYNVSGQEVFNEKIFDTGYHEYDPGLKDGIYIVTYTSGSFRSTKKLFIKKP